MGESEMLDGVAKQRVKAALRALVEADLRSSRQAVADERSAAELDPESSYSSDDLSQSDEGGELAGLFAGAVDRKEVLLGRIDALDFGPQSAVVPGAIIAFGGDHYVVGVVADAFDCDGVTYEGISADSPVYAAIKGLRGGDSFTFNGHEHRIDLVA
jgi:hypothetical protein